MPSGYYENYSGHRGGYINPNNSYSTWMNNDSGGIFKIHALNDNGWLDNGYYPMWQSGKKEINIFMGDNLITNPKVSWWKDSLDVTLDRVFKGVALWAVARFGFGASKPVEQKPFSNFVNSSLKTFYNPSWLDIPAPTVTGTGVGTGTGFGNTSKSNVAGNPAKKSVNANSKESNVIAGDTGENQNKKVGGLSTGDGTITDALGVATDDPYGPQRITGKAKLVGNKRFTISDKTNNSENPTEYTYSVENKSGKLTAKTEKIVVIVPDSLSDQDIRNLVKDHIKGANSYDTIEGLEMADGKLDFTTPESGSQGLVKMTAVSGTSYAQISGLDGFYKQAGSDSAATTKIVTITFGTNGEPDVEIGTK